MALISTEEKSVLWRTNRDDVARTLGAGQGLAADAVLEAGVAGVHKAVPGPDLARGPAASTALAPGLVASHAPGPGESLTPSHLQSPAPGSQSPVPARRSHAVAPPAPNPALASLAPRAAPKPSPTETPGAAPRRSPSVRDPGAARLLQWRMEMESGPSPVPAPLLLKKTGVSPSRPASVRCLALLHVRSLVPALALPLKTSAGTCHAQFSVNPSFTACEHPPNAAHCSTDNETCQIRIGFPF